MSSQPPQQVRVQIPPQIVVQLQRQGMALAANAVVMGDYEGSEIIPDNHKLLIAEMLLTLTQNPAVDAVKCANCQQIRLEHPLSLETGYRPCPDHVQVQGQPTKTFKPPQQEQSRIVQPTADEVRKIVR